MGTTLQETPSGNRLHIGIFGKTNSGKSAFINAFSGQSVSIVADVKGTTTDPVYKAMEIAPLGPCVSIRRDLTMRENWEPCGWKRRRWLHRKRNWH